MSEIVIPGICEISSNDYHSHFAISRSRLTKMRKTPRHYYHEYKNIDFIKPEPTAAMIFGSAYHTKILEPHLFEKEYFALPELDRRTKDGKALYQLTVEHNAGKQVLNNEQYLLLDAMAHEMKKNDEAMLIIEGSKVEQSLFWIDEETNIPLKIRPDIWNDQIIGDLKTTDNAAEWAFKNSLEQYGYHIQAAMIREGFLRVMNMDMRDFIYIVQEKTAPYAIAIYILSEEALEEGHMEFRRLLEKLSECIETDNWPSYPTKIINLPSYVKYRSDEE